VGFLGGFFVFLWVFWVFLGGFIWVDFLMPTLARKAKNSVMVVLFDKKNPYFAAVS
jgi:hypothetical protein